MSITLKIDGMSCNHCVKKITEALLEVDGITDVKVSLENGEAIINGNEIDSESLIELLDDLGFDGEVK